MSPEKYIAVSATKRRYLYLLFVLLFTGMTACNRPEADTFLSDRCTAANASSKPLQVDTLDKNRLSAAFSVQYPDSLGTPNRDIPFRRVDSVWAFVSDKKYVVWFDDKGYIGHTQIPLLNRLSDVCYLNREEFIVSCFDFKSPVIRYHAGNGHRDTLFKPNDSLYYAPLAFLGAGIEKLGRRYLVPFVSVNELEAGHLYSVFDSTFARRERIPGFYRFDPDAPYYPYQGNCQLALKNDHSFFVAFTNCGTVYELEMEPASARYRVVSETVFPSVAPVDTVRINSKEEVVRMSDLIVESPYWFNVKYDAEHKRLHRFHKLAQPLLDEATRKMRKSGDASWLWIAKDLDDGREQARCFRGGEFMFTLGYLSHRGRYLLAGETLRLPDVHTNSISFYEINFEK